MKISLLCPNLSENCLGRAYILARVLSRKYEVEVIGPAFDKGVWPPCDTGEFDYKLVPGRMYPLFLKDIREILKLISGDVIYASKLLPTSFGIALLARWRKRTPVVLDIDDYEVGLFPQRKLTDVIYHRVRIHDPNALPYVRSIEGFHHHADQITTVSRFLQSRYGGVIVPHGRDTAAFDPALFESETLRREWKLDNEMVAMFMGTPRLHKGLNDLIEAVKLVKTKNLKLMVVGGPLDDAAKEKMKRELGDRVILAGVVPFSKVPSFLSMADVVVIPQRKSPATEGQIPAKLFDAMATAKPVISTSVSDIPQILDRCGLVVEPGNAQQIAEKIDFVLANEEMAREMGRKAREKCIQLYSWDAMEKTLTAVFDRYC